MKQVYYVRYQLTPLEAATFAKIAEEQGKSVYDLLVKYLDEAIVAAETGKAWCEAQRLVATHTK